jgi:hypothetical protein
MRRAHEVLSVRTRDTYPFTTPSRSATMATPHRRARRRKGVGANPVKGSGGTWPKHEIWLAAIQTKPRELPRLRRGPPALSARRAAWRPTASVLRDGDTVDLDVEGARPLRHAEEDAGRRVLREKALVDLVERLEAVGRDAQHVALQHMVEVRNTI